MVTKRSAFSRKPFTWNQTRPWDTRLGHDLLERAVRLSGEAIRLDDVTGYARIAMAHVHLSRRAYDEALTEANRAVSDRLNCPTAYSLKASVLTYLRRATEAVEFAQYASRLTPVHPDIYPGILASAYYSCDR